MDIRREMRWMMNERGDKVDRGEANLSSTVEDRIFRLFVLYVISGGCPWAKKWITMMGGKDRDVSTEDSGVYVLVSPWCRHFYIGCTSRKVIVRWTDHVKKAVSGSLENAPKLHAWLRIFGWRNYLVLPLVSNTQDPMKVERALIRRFSPALNTQGTRKEEGRVRRRKGRREGGKRKYEHMGGSIIRFHGRESIIDLVKEMSRTQGDHRITSTGGNMWIDIWRVVKGKIGQSSVSVGGRAILIKDCKGILEGGGEFPLIDIWIVPASLEHRRNILRELRRNPDKVRGMYKKSSQELIAMYRTCSLFADKKVWNRLKTTITKVVKTKYGAEVRRRPCVKVPFSPSIRMGEVMRVAASIIEQTISDRCIRRFVVTKVRAVTKKRRTIGSIIHNHRTFAKMDQAQCRCGDVDLPKIEEHVKIRLDRIYGVPRFITNSRNVTSGYVIPEEMLWECIMEGVGLWTKGRQVLIDRSEVRKCYQVRQPEHSAAMSVREVMDWVKPYEVLVAVPIDRNPGATLLICP
ncbi:hypothetical protein CBR_g4508 [Chara braunii]|uniref:GIY-YIG domain-containing protein n=1 Tax=Chara braunii TaxID=69332 RepID=A0A388KI40_CHABU|nr:hypothetical protein CBR_g4508 [Chara braunii]|eukprot:GBG69678.1 hypothetical protein CBR_g4508 [Chara braunii]